MRINLLGSASRLVTFDKANEGNGMSAQDNPIKLHAIELAKSANKDLLETVDRLNSNNLEEKRKLLTVFEEMGDCYGEKLLEFPRPGTDTGNNAELYSIGGVTKTGKASNRKRSFYSDYAEATPRGVKVKAQIAETDDMADGAHKDSKLAALRAQLEYLKGVYQRTMTFAYLLGDVKDMCGDKVSVSILPEDPEDADSAHSRSTKPIYVVDISNMPASAANGKIMSVGSFLQLKPRAGMNYKELIATGNRNVDKTKPTGFEVKTVTQFDQAIASVGNFLDEKDSLAMVLRTLAKPGSDHLVEGIGDLELLVKEVMEAPEMRDRYKAIKTGKAGKVGKAA